MSESMVERAARAMWARRWDNGDEDWSSEPKRVRAEYQKDARAAIAALREPTEAMIAAAKAKRWVGAIDDGPGIEFDPTPEDAWGAMIDQILSEHPQRSDPVVAERDERD